MAQIGLHDASNAASGSQLGLLGTLPVWDERAMNGRAPAWNAAGASRVWPSANLAMFAPFSIDEALTVTRLWWLNGSVSSGNVDAGLYNEDGSKIVTAGSTAMGTASTLQSVTVSQTLAAGSYFMAFACDNATASFSGFNFATNQYQAVGVQHMATAFPLPSTATFANPGSTILPMFGISTLSAI